MELMVTIGIDPPIVDSLRERLDARVVAYPDPPRLYAIDGRVRVASATVADRWLEPRGLVFYGYFDDAGAARRALALGATPTFPDVGATLPLDDRAIALALAMRADGRRTGRGFMPRGLAVDLDREHVIKWGNRHCGEDKARVDGHIDFADDAVIEPFVVGRSERILIVGDDAWQLRYESADWRKNVRPTVTRVALDAPLHSRARRTIAPLGLEIAGVDYVVTDDDAMLLEVNAYPGLDDVPEASEAFVAMVSHWWTRAIAT